MPLGGERKMKCVGLDVHKEYCDATVLDENGRRIKSGKFRYTRKGFEGFFRDITDARVAMEAGYCWQPAYELLESMNLQPVLAHPLKTRLIADVKVKTDAKASEALAQLLLMDWLPTAYVPPREIRELRELTRLRTYLVWERTRFKNKVHAAMVREGIRGEKNIFAKKRRLVLQEFEIDEVNRCLDIIDTLDKHINELSAEIRRRAGESEEAKLLMTIPGVGYHSAVAVLAEIGDVSRFPSPDKLASYAGLVPSTKQSGGKMVHGKLTKQGSPTLRRVLVECVWMHLIHGGDTSLTRFFRRVARRKGKQKAAVATARKLLHAMWAMLKEKQKFRPL